MKEKEIVLNKLHNEPTLENLWEALLAFQNEIFYTVSGLPFKYVVKQNKKGNYTRELIIDRRKESKPLTWSSFQKAFENIVPDRVYHRPKGLLDCRGISYIFPIFVLFGLVHYEPMKEE